MVRKKEPQSLHYDESYRKKIADSFDRLGAAEKKAAAYIAEHGPACTRMSVSQLAGACGCSPASIVRLSKDLGYSGFSELKFNIQQDSSAVSEDNLSISRSDPPEVVVEKTFHFAQQSLNNLYRHLDNDALRRASRAIAEADHVLFCALGSACGAALAGVNHLLSAGINATFQMDDLLQMRVAAYFHPGDVVIGINYDGYAKNVTDTLRTARQAGATTILLTSVPDGLGARYADIILRTPKRNVNNSLNYSTTTVCQVMLIHLLTIGAWQWSQDKVQEKTARMRALTNIKRYSQDTEKVEIKPVRQ